MKKIIFDLDDTLYKDKSLRGEREKAIIKALKGKTKKYRELRKTCSTIESLEKLGVSRKEFYEIMGKVPIKLKKDKELREFITELESKYKLVVLTNSPSWCAKKILTQLGILNLIDKIYGGDCFKEAKPSEECFFMVNKGDICVGNNFKKDLSVPQKKGAVTVLISEEDSADSDFNIRNIYELSRVIEAIETLQ